MRAIKESRIKQLVDLLPLNEGDKINFYKKVKVSMISNVEFLQGNIYIFLNSRETVRLMRGTEEIYRLIKKIEELSLKEILIDEKFEDNRKIFWTNEEIEFLKKNKEKSLYFLSMKLNRSIAAIKAKKRKEKNNF